MLSTTGKIRFFALVEHIYCVIKHFQTCEKHRDSLLGTLFLIIYRCSCTLLERFSVAVDCLIVEITLA